MSRVDELIEAMLTREVEPGNRAELEALLAGDAEMLAYALSAYRLIQMLPLALRGRGGDRFAEAVTRRLRPPSGRFVARVRDSVRRRAIEGSAGS